MIGVRCGFYLRGRFTKPQNPQDFVLLRNGSFTRSDPSGRDERFPFKNRIGHLRDTCRHPHRRTCHGSIGAKCLGLKELAEREGFEPSVQVLARTTV